MWAVSSGWRGCGQPRIPNGHLVLTRSLSPASRLESSQRQPAGSAAALSRGVMVPPGLFHSKHRRFLQSLERSSTAHRRGRCLPCVYPDDQVTYTEARDGVLRSAPASDPKITAHPRASPSSRGLGFSPFKAETRVRIPLGTPPPFGPFPQTPLSPCNAGGLARLRVRLDSYSRPGDVRASAP